MLSDLALRSKAYWGYDAEFLAACRAELTLDPGRLAAERTAVAEIDGRPAGLVSVLGEPPLGEIGMLFVDPEHIGSGVGGALWRHALAEARAAGFGTLELVADPGAVGFYLRMGARRAGEVPSESIPGRTLPLMTYHL